ncbi:phosphoribosylanthranilate isomerase [Candidatus Agathobaculum pullicola]|uniref:phosphoribosylanthranilate isomerase n=1 Tax=Candidatus Agathobaculum pullicola TaxID=2838426 RepID=UPI003F933265
MTGIKFCGLSRESDIRVANELKPQYVGFVFAPKSKRYVTPEKAGELKQMLASDIKAVGVFVDEKPETVADCLNNGIIDIAQLHGHESDDYITQLRRHTKRPIMKAFRIKTASDIADVEQSAADFVLLDSGAGTGAVFDWNLIRNIHRPYFLAGGLESGNVGAAIRTLHPFAVDVSSGIETDGRKDKTKMAAFVAAVRKEDKR